MEQVLCLALVSPMRFAQRVMRKAIYLPLECSGHRKVLEGVPCPWGGSTLDPEGCDVDIIEGRLLHAIVASTFCLGI